MRRLTSPVGGSCRGRAGGAWAVGSTQVNLAPGLGHEVANRSISWGGTESATRELDSKGDMNGPVQAACLEGRSEDEEEEEEEEEEDKMWEKIEKVRHHLTRTLNPAKLTPYLRQCRVIDEQDEEEVLNTNRLPTRTSQTGRLIDILRKRGKRGYVSFLESLEFYYPEQFSRLTGKKPVQRCSMILDEEGPEGLTQFLMTELRNQRIQLRQRQAREQQLTVQSQALQEEKTQLERQVEELQRNQQHHSTLRAERDRDLLELQRLKDENYSLALRYAQLSEEKNLALMRSRDLQLQVDQLKSRVSSLEEECSLVRKRSIRLQHDLAERSRDAERETVSGLQAENERLKTSLQEMQKALKAGEAHVPEAGKILLEILEQDRKEALEEQQEQSIKVQQLQCELYRAEQLRNKYLQDTEELQLRQQSAQKDCELYRQRMNTVLGQLAEVEKERDQAIHSRDQVQRQTDQSMLDKDYYRKQVRALEEERDSTQTRLTHLEALNSRLQAQLQQVHGEHASWGPGLSDSISLDSSWSQPNISPISEDFHSIPDSCDTLEKVAWATRKRLRCAPREGRSKSLDLDGSWSSLDGSHRSELIDEVNRLSLMPFPPGQGSLLRRQQEDWHASIMASFSHDSGISNIERTGNGNATPLHSCSASPTSPSGTRRLRDSWANKEFHPRQLTITLSEENLSTNAEHRVGGFAGNITIVGGNMKGIYVKWVKPASEAEKAGLGEGCRLLKLMATGVSPLSLEHCTKEVAHLCLQLCEDASALTFRVDKEGYERLVERLDRGKHVFGDSFYVRANLDIRVSNEPGALRVRSKQILHVVDTMFQGRFEWFCARVDALTQMELDRGTIPNYSRAQQMLLNQQSKGSPERLQKLLGHHKKQAALKEKSKAAGGEKKPVESAPSIADSEEKLDPKPYSILWPHRAQTCRPVIFSPCSLARGLIRCFLELPASSLDFDFCPSEILLEEDLITCPGIIMLRSVPPNQGECVRIRSIQDCIRKNKHCLLELGVTAVKELVRNNIFPIIIHIQATDKNLKKLLNQLQLPGLSPSDMLKTAHTEVDVLSNLPYPWACMEPKSGSRVEDLVKALRSLIFQEQPKLLWVEDDKL
ncbi:caspase recruitment domain-containing protein 10 isoform X2 [Ambystoma mexicanum]|uniref:caspase recruitment domain-containing protein 10 isoform X2 n=1 Tax=Ambystoma mexicanum TaxID=8296 RepID=UPI0037E985F9